MNLNNKYRHFKIYNQEYEISITQKYIALML